MRRASASASRAGCSTATAQPVPDCMLEIWQADAQGRFADPQDKRALPNSSVQGVRPLRHRRERRLCVRHHQAGLGARSRRQAAGAAYPARDLRARHAAASLYADLFRRRGGQCRRSRAGAGAGRSPRHADRRRASRARRAPSTSSTSTCRATTRRCSSKCEVCRALDHATGIMTRSASFRYSITACSGAGRLLAQRGLGRADHDRQRDRAQDEQHHQLVVVRERDDLRLQVDHHVGHGAAACRCRGRSCCATSGICSAWLNGLMCSDRIA